MNTRMKTLKELKKLGFVFHRQGANHEVYTNWECGKSIPVPRHNFDENTMRYILKEANAILNKKADE